MDLRGQSASAHLMDLREPNASACIRWICENRMLCEKVHSQSPVICQWYLGRIWWICESQMLAHAFNGSARTECYVTSICIRSSWRYIARALVRMDVTKKWWSLLFPLRTTDQEWAYLEDTTTLFEPASYGTSEAAAWKNWEYQQQNSHLIWCWATR